MSCTFFKTLLVGGLLAFFGLFATHASAVTLNLLPASSIATPGDTVTLDLVISGLTAGGPDSLGDFDIDIRFDTGALSLVGYSLGAFLGDLGLGEATDFSLGDLGGLVNVAEVSLLEPSSNGCVFCVPPYLDDIQPASFTLATFNFMVDVLPVGSSTVVSIETVNALGDGFGRPLPLEITENAVIRNPSSDVPEPSTISLIILGLLGTCVVRYRARAQR